jgi:cysteine synthase
MRLQFNNNPESIGNTPLVKINRLNPNGHCPIYAKIEGRNPAYSVKCRIGAAMIKDAEEKGILNKDRVIIEPTSGNTGIALAFTAAAKGYKIILTMPETMSMERRKILKIFGAEVMLTEGALGMKGAIEKANQLVESDPDKYIMMDQFNNPANPEIHYQTTGPEIWKDSDGKVDVFVAGVGTGGTISGGSRFLKEKNPNLISVAIEPENSRVITQKLANKELKPGPHKIQGIGAGFIPGVLDLSILDRVEGVSNEEAYEYAYLMATKEGILCGISSGAAMAVAVRLAQKKEFQGKTFVVILPDSGERYLSTNLFDDFV